MKKSINDSIEKIIDYLKNKGCTKIVLFGSVSEGEATKDSDIDLAVEGIVPRAFFTAIVDLPLITGRVVDLIDLNDLPLNIRNEILENGRVIYAGR